MKEVISVLIGGSQSVSVLPNRWRPRLYFFKGDARERWNYSAFYPAYRRIARIYRLMLRCKALLGWVDAPKISYNIGTLRDFLKVCLPSFKCGVVFVGTPGPAQKFTVQLWDDFQVIGYLKYGKKPTARARLQKEYAILNSLPDGLGPRVLLFGEFAEGLALVLAPVPGRSLPARISSLANADNFIYRLVTAGIHEAANHPWIRHMLERHNSLIDPWVDAFKDAYLPVVIQHGDFAPWNIYYDSSGIMTAIDWEYGTIVGFPYLDRAFFILQVTLLMNRWSPVRAREFAVQKFKKVVSEIQAQAIVRMAAFDAFHKYQDDGCPKDDPNQRWRRAVWEAQ
jgi:hypothetical protein